MRRAGDPEGKLADSCPLQWLPIEPFESSFLSLAVGQRGARKGPAFSEQCGKPAVVS